MPDDAPSCDEVPGAQFGPHRFSAGEGGGDARLRGARVEVADLRGARFVDCDWSGARISDGWLVDVGITGYVEGLTVNGVDVTDYVHAELDRRHPERVQFRDAQSSDDLRELWSTVERLWAAAVARAGRLPADARWTRVDDEWSFVETLRHLIFITDAWASRTVLDEERPYHPIGLPQRWYPAADAVALGIDLSADPPFEEVLAVRANRLAVVRHVLDGVTGEELERGCERTPAPGYPDEPRTVLDCLVVVIDEELEHHRFAVRDLEVLEATLPTP